jgi:cytochrome P450 PksS
LVLAKAEGERLDADEVLAMAFLLLVAGHETTVNLIGNGMLALIEHPEALARLREDPEAVKPAVEEMLRYCGPLMTATERYASEELELGDTTIPQGSLVYVSVASANRDQAAFPQADQFLIGREPNRHLAFGHGMHFCLGSSLARMEGQIALGAFASRFPNVRLAVDRSRLRWKGGVTLRGLLSLPLAIR